MKKEKFYDDVKTNAENITGLSRAAWYRNNGSIVLQTSKRLVVLSCSKNVVTLYTKLDGEKGETFVTDYNDSYKENIAILTAEKIDKFLTI